MSEAARTCRACGETQPAEHFLSYRNKNGAVIWLPTCRMCQQAQGRIHQKLTRGNRRTGSASRSSRS